MTIISGQRQEGQAPPGIQDIVELAGVWYWETDAGHRLRAIVAPERDRHRPVPSYIGLARWELPGAEALGTSWETHRATLETHRPFRDFCYIVRVPGQAPRFVSATGEPLFAADGAFRGYRGTSRDITEQWLANQRLGETETLLSVAARLSRMRAWSIEVATGLLTWSDMLGDGHPAVWKSADARGLLDIYTPDSRERLIAAYDECVRHGTPYELEVEAQVRNRRRWVRMIAVPARDAQGRVVRVQGAFLDITASKNALEEHRQLAKHLTNTIDSLPFGFGTVDCEWRIRSANPMAEQILGLSRGELIGARLWDAFPGLADTRFGEIHRRAMAQRSVEEFEGLYEPLGIWIRARSFPSEDGIAIAFSDVSNAWLAQQEVSRLNAELEQRVAQRTAQLEAATRDLEAFAYTVAHDLRAPLAAIAGYSKALEHSPEQRLGERSSHYLERIQAATRRLDQMTEAILSLSKLNRVQPRWRDVDLAELARHTLAMLRESQPQRRVECRVPDSLPVKGDPALLQIVVDNLLANAWKYTAPRVHPVIEVGATATPDGQAACFVRDNGVGFDPAQTQRLFEPFSRIHGPEFEGTGIGLATVARIVARHGGRVWVEAAPGVGATFHFTLAAQPPDS